MNQKNKGHYKGVLSSFMATAMATSLIPIHHSQAYTGFADVAASHWALPAINRLDSAGLMKGYSSDFFGVGDQIKRGDFALIICNLMGYEVESTTFFQDLESNNNKYYNSALYKLNAALIMTGVSDWDMGAEEPITREQACFIMAKAFNVEPSTATSPFTDGAQVSSYAQGYVQAMVEKGIIGGFEDGSFGPRQSITRDQFAGILSNFAATILTDTYSDPYISEGTVVVRSKDHDLSDAKITGDLILAEGITDGEVHLDNVSVAGNIIIKGGGVDSIYLNDVKVEGKVLVSRQAAPVRVVFSGDTTVPLVEVKNSTTLDITELSDAGSVQDLSIVAENYLYNDNAALKDSMDVHLIGNYDTVTNDTSGVTITTEGYVTSFVLNENATINGSDFESDTEVDPDFPITEPTLVTVHDYGSANDDDELVPEASSTAEVVYFNEKTGEVEVEITVEDLEDCVLLHDNVNAVKILNPTNNAGIATMDYVIGRTTYSKYTVFDVSFTMTQPCDEIQFQLTFKAEDEEPTVNLSTNFNDMSSASATVAIAEDGITTASSGITTAFIEVSRVRNCEPHYSTDYVITQTNKYPEDLLESITYVSYDEEDDIYTYKVTFDSSELDSVDLTVNFLQIDAEDSMPPVRGSLYYGDTVLVSRLAMTQYDLNEFGMMTLDIIVDNSELQSKEKDENGDEYTKYYQLKSSMSRALTIVADSGETEKGYGLEYEASLSHDGSTSTYTVTFLPSYDLDQVYFAINLDDRDEGIPGMSPTSNLTARLDSAELSKYFVIHSNTKTYSSRGVATVQVSVKDLEDITGYTLDVFNPITVYDNYNDTSAETEDELYQKELSDYSITAVDDETYEITFVPNTRTVTDTASDGTSTTTTVARPVKIQLNLEREENFVGLFGSATVSVTEGLPYAKEVTLLDGENDYEYQLQLTVDNSSGNWTAANGYSWTDGDADKYNPNSFVYLILDTSEDNKEVITDKLKKLAVTVVPSTTAKTATLTIRFDTASRVNPEDLAFRINTPGDVIYVEPTIAFNITDKDGNGDFIASVAEYDITDFDDTTGETIVNFDINLKALEAVKFEIPSDADGVSRFITTEDANISSITFDVDNLPTHVEEDVINCTVEFTKASTTSTDGVEFDLNFVQVLTPDVKVTSNLDAAITVSPVDDSDYRHEKYQYSVDVTVTEGNEFADTTLKNNFTIDGSSDDIISVTQNASDANQYTVTFNSNNASSVEIAVEFKEEALLTTPTESDVLSALTVEAGLQANAMELTESTTDNTINFTKKEDALHGAVYVELGTDVPSLRVNLTVDDTKNFYVFDYSNSLLDQNPLQLLFSTSNSSAIRNFSYNKNGGNSAEIYFKLVEMSSSSDDSVIMLKEATTDGTLVYQKNYASGSRGFTFFTLADDVDLLEETISFDATETLVLLDSNGITASNGGSISLDNGAFLIYDNVKYEVTKENGPLVYEVDNMLASDVNSVISAAKIDDDVENGYLTEVATT